MKDRIGLIQTCGIGDIIIALPIADFFIEQGHDVHWPIDEQFIHFFRDAKPEVDFIPIARDVGAAEQTQCYLFDDPMKWLRSRNCTRIISLYSGLKNIPTAPAATALKFDEYKYAAAGVPFSRKWKLRIRRNAARELALHQRLGINRQYLCLHTTGSDRSVAITLSHELQEKYQIIEVRELTDNPFDWLHTLEHAGKLVLLDSCFSNLVDQLNFQMSKSLILRSNVLNTPVMSNGWEFLCVPRASVPRGRR